MQPSSLRRIALKREIQSPSTAPAPIPSRISSSSPLIPNLNNLSTNVVKSVNYNSLAAGLLVLATIAP